VTPSYTRCTRTTHRTFILKSDCTVSAWRRLDSEEHRNLYWSQDAITLIKSSRMRCWGYLKIGNVCRMWGADMTNSSCRERWTEIGRYFLIKPPRCTNFTNLFCHETLHVSDSSSAHHQQFIHCTLSSGICHTDSFRAGPGWNCSSVLVLLYDIFCHETLHVSDSSSAHHQQFIRCSLGNGICHTGL
jgi:hypothetical protein